MTVRDGKERPWFEADATDIDQRDCLSDRQLLLACARWFAKHAYSLPGVKRIALIGSLATDKRNPKDLDLLVSLNDDADVKPIADMARKTQGRCQRGRLGVDVFLAQGDEYIGRCCSYREPHPRVACGENLCDTERSHLCWTSFRLATDVVVFPPLIAWPSWQCGGTVPEDTRMALSGIGD